MTKDGASEAALAGARDWWAKHGHLVPRVVKDEIGSDQPAVVGKPGRTARVESLSDERLAGFANHRSTTGRGRALSPWPGLDSVANTSEQRPTEDEVIGE